MTNRICTSSIFGILAFILTGMAGLNAQEMPTRYATIELFTNTPCPICVSSNPGFFDLIDNYEGYHLISFYPGRPYSTCPIYQENPTENEARTAHRDVFGTPTVNFNGVSSKSSGSVNANDMEAVLGGESFLYVKVSETSGNNRTASVRLQTLDDSPTSMGRLYVAAVEAEVLLTGIPGNWEDEHFNVFRKFLTPSSGQMVDLTMADQTIDFNYTIESGWDPAQMYVLAWVENPDTDETYNSGTRFDEAFSSTNEVVFEDEVSIFPNPANESIQIDWPSSFDARKVSIFNSQGSRVISGTADRTLGVSSLSKGVYILQITGSEGGKLIRKFIKN